MYLEHFRMLIHEILNKDIDIVPEEATITILDSNSAVYMPNNCKDTYHTRHIAIRSHFVRNCDKCKMHNIDWCEGGLKLA